VTGLVSVVAMTAALVANATGGRLTAGSPDVVFASVSIDSRTVAAGALSMNWRNHSSSIISCQSRWRWSARPSRCSVQRRETSRSLNTPRSRKRPSDRRPSAIGASGPRSHSPIGASKPCLPRSRIPAGTFFSSNPKAYKDGFKEIEKKLTVNADGRYVFSYCSPKRRGSHKVEVEAVTSKDRGRVMIKVNADGFGSGCSPTRKLDLAPPTAKKEKKEAEGEDES